MIAQLCSDIDNIVEEVEAESKEKTASTIRSSAAEYLSFIAASGNGGVEAVYAECSGACVRVLP